MVPPLGRIPRHRSTSSGMDRFSMTPLQPSRKPTSSLSNTRSPFRTTALITALRPGQSPPPVRTPTRIPATVPVRRLALAGLAAALFSLVAAPNGASAQETTTALRAKRAVLVNRIAALTDEADRAAAKAVDADRRRTM